MEERATSIEIPISDLLFAMTANMREAFAVFQAVRDDQGAVRDFRPVHWNLAAAQRLGSPSADLTASTLTELIPGDDIGSLVPMLQAVLETGDPLETFYVMPTGITERRVRVRAIPTEGDFLAVTAEDLPFDGDGATRDEPRLHTLVQHGWDLLSIINQEFDVTWASPSWLPVLGYDPEYIVRENPDLLHPDEWERVNRGFLRMAELPDGSSSSLKFKMRRADGEYRTFEVRLTTLFNDLDVRGIVAAARDVTERDEAFENLRRSDERARSLLEQAHDLVCLIDIDGRVTYLSESFATVLGWDIDAITGVVPEQFVHPDDWPTLIESLGALSEGEHADVRLRVRHQDGRWRALDGSARNLFHLPSVDGLALNVRDITDEAEALDALVASQRRYRALTERSADMVAIYDKQLHTLYASPAHQEFFGPRGPAEDADHRLSHVHPADLAEKVAAPLERVLAAPGSCETSTFRWQHSDGTWRHIEASLTNRIDVPDVGGLVLNARDVTQRVEAEQALREREERFRALTERSFDLLTIFDERLRPTYVSPSHRTMLGHEIDKSSMEMAVALVHPDDFVPGLVKPMLRASCAARRSVTTHFRMRHVDGGWRHLEATITNMLDNRAVSGIVVNSRDVTDQVMAEHALRMEKDRFHSLIRNSADVVLVVGPGGDITYASPSLRDVVGIAPEQVMGSRVGTLPIHPEDVPVASSATAAASGEPHGESRYECRIHHADAQWRWVEVDVRNLLDEPAVGGLVLHMRDVTDRRRAEQELAHRALHDELTGLPNRSLLIDRLTQSLARSTRTGLSTMVLFLDLDRFKLVNDSFGHAEGDELLCAVGERLSVRVRATDTVARLGGDEFVVLVEEVSGADSAVEVAEKLLSSFQEPFLVNGLDQFVTASMGLALSDRDATADSMLRDADAAMYEAKERGRDRLEQFSDRVRDRAVLRSRIDHDLHLALERDELRLVFQPAFDVATLRVVGVEALVRWAHPERGQIHPVEFVPIAEENGLILPIGEWVLDRACAQAAEWAKIDPRTPPTVWVNVSARQLATTGFADLVRDTLARHQLEPGLLGLELTESVLIEEAETTDTQLRVIEELGVRLAIDDFGTGYSSLLYLQRFRVDVLKLDRSFVRELGRNIDDHAISSAVIRLGHSLGMEVSAEGVEEHQQLDLLRALGCDVACGYLLARPGPPEDVTERLWAAAEL